MNLSTLFWLGAGLAMISILAVYYLPRLQAFCQRLRNMRLHGLYWRSYFVSLLGLSSVILSVVVFVGLITITGGLLLGFRPTAALWSNLYLVIGGILAGVLGLAALMAIPHPLPDHHGWYHYETVLRERMVDGWDQARWGNPISIAYSLCAELVHALSEWVRRS